MRWKAPSEPYWRSDGKEVFYLNGNKLMAVEVNGDDESFGGVPKDMVGREGTRINANGMAY